MAALTTYINRVVFPRLIKKIAVERLENSLKRKVEMGSIRFSWVKGFIIDRIKIYEKGSSNSVFAQADQVSFGIIFFPGFKHPRITIPFITIRSPSVNLIRTTDTSWNFSDILASQTQTPPEPTPALPNQHAPVQIAWGGVAISNGKFLVEDDSNQRQWSEFFDNVNLKLSLSYRGISYDFTADIPKGDGLLAATVFYQPISQNTQAHIHLKNIDTASYLSLINTPDLHLKSGIIKEINLDISRSQDKLSAGGDVLMNNFDITSLNQRFKGDIQIQGLDAQYLNGNFTAHGQFELNNMQTLVPGLSASGNVQTTVNNFEYSSQGATFSGALNGQNISVNLNDRQMQANKVYLDNIQIKKDHDGIQYIGNIVTQGLLIQWPHQRLQGDIDLKSLIMRMKDENNVSLEGDVQARNFEFDEKTSDGFNLVSHHLLLENAQLEILDQKNITLNTKLSLETMRMIIGKNSFSSSLLKTDKFLFNLNDDIIKISSTLNATQGKLVLDHRKSIQADPQLELALRIPLDSPQDTTYKGSVTFSDAHLQGFLPFPSLDNVELDADFKNDEATINALSINILDTNVSISGTIKDFKNPYLSIIADADDFNLASIQELAPQIIKKYGLTFNGKSRVKIKFEGLLENPEQAKVLGVASVKDVSVSSSKFHQQINNITGIIEITPNFLKWRDFTATYQGKHYSSFGSLHNFKNPKIITTIDGPNFELNTNLVKDKNTITINSLTGKYLNATFNSTGSISQLESDEPVFDINTNASILLEDLINNLPVNQKRVFQSLNPRGIISVTSDLEGTSLKLKDYTLTATISSPTIRLKGYTLNDLKINFDQEQGNIKNLTFDGKFYGGIVHAVGSLNLLNKSLPYDLALNIDKADLHQFKMDSPFKMDELNGKFFFTTLAHGTVANFKDNLHATGSLSIRDGYLGEFNLFKGLLDILNDAMDMGKVVITDVEANFTIDHQRMNTDNLRLKGPTVVLLGQGWVNFDQICDLYVTIDLSSSNVPAIAHDVLKSLNIHIYDKISSPKFGKKISVPQVINTLLKNLWQ